MARFSIYYYFLKLFFKNYKDHLSKLKSRTGLANGLSGLMLLGNVLVGKLKFFKFKFYYYKGVCFILTSVIICHYWASNSTRYQPVGRIAVRICLIIVYFLK
jgi:hypothetical protein